MEGEIKSIVGDQAVVEPKGDLPKMGSPVFVKKGKLGTVCDIIGNVESPYFIVKVAKGMDATIGESASDR